MSAEKWEANFQCTPKGKVAVDQSTGNVFLREKLCRCINGLISPLNSKQIITYNKAIYKLKNDFSYKMIRIITKKILQTKRLIR